MCTAVLLLFAVGFTAMARHIRVPAPSTPTSHTGFGRHIGLGAAFLALLSYTAVQGGVYGYIGAAINDLVTSHGGPSVPWYLYALAMMAVVGTLGYRHIELSGKVLGVLLICEVGIVMVINVAVIGHGGGTAECPPPRLHPGNFFSGAPGIALIFALAGYIGFEATAVFRDEARDPARTIPRATYIALLLIGGFYALISWVMVSAWGDEGAVQLATDNPAGMLTETATRYVGSVAGDLVQIFSSPAFSPRCCRSTTCWRAISFRSATPRRCRAKCGRSHTRHASPHIASVVQTVSALVLVVASVLAVSTPSLRCSPGSSGSPRCGIVVLMTLTSAAVVVYFRRTKFDTRPWHTLVAPGLGLVGLAVLPVMTAVNLPLLVGGSTTLAAVIGVLLVGTFAGGAVVAACARTQAAPMIPHPFDRQGAHLMSTATIESVDQTPSAAPDHPLAPLTADEIRAVRRIVDAHGLLGDSVRFVYVALDEPHKKTVLAFSPGDPIERRARVLLLDRATGLGSDLVVSITDDRVVAQQSIDAGTEGHVPILDQEFEDIEAFLLESPEWLDAMKQAQPQSDRCARRSAVGRRLRSRGRGRSARRAGARLLSVRRGRPAVGASHRRRGGLRRSHGPPRAKVIDELDLRCPPNEGSGTPNRTPCPRALT